jgi:hypothetical protein
MTTLGFGTGTEKHKSIQAEKKAGKHEGGTAGKRGSGEGEKTESGNLGGGEVMAGKTTSS